MKLNCLPVRFVHDKVGVVLCVNAFHMATELARIGELFHARVAGAESAVGFARVELEEPSCWPFVIGMFAVITRHWGRVREAKNSSFQRNEIDCCNKKRIAMKMVTALVK